MSNRFDWAEQLELRIGILEDQIATNGLGTIDNHERRTRIKLLRSQQTERGVYRDKLPTGFDQ